MHTGEPNLRYRIAALFSTSALPMGEVMHFVRCPTAIRQLSLGQRGQGFLGCSQVRGVFASAWVMFVRKGRQRGLVF